MIPFYSKHNSDCLRACISSLIEIDIPNLPQLNNNWFESINSFLTENYNIQISHQKNQPSYEYYIAVYKNPYKELNYHAVICNNSNEIVHNPSKSDDYDYKSLLPDYFITHRTNKKE